jgi:hypothetical protein
MGADFVKIYAPGFPRETFAALNGRNEATETVCWAPSASPHSMLFSILRKPFDRLDRTNSPYRQDVQDVMDQLLNEVTGKE